MAFPSTLSSFPRPTPTDRLNNPSHSALHNTTSSALGQVEAVIGLDGANSVLGTLMTNVRSPGSDGGGHIQSANKGGTGQISYAKGDLLVAQSSSVLSKLSIGTTGQILTVDPNQATGLRWGSGKFGGTGADGSFSNSSGTTTLNIGSVLVYTKNYTSISLTGTGILGFTSANDAGTVVVLKSQGDVTLTSSSAPMIDVSGIGTVAVGMQTFTGGSSGQIAGANGIGTVVNFTRTYAGTGATTSPAVGAGGSVASFLYNSSIAAVFAKYPQLFVGASGANGGYNVSAGSGTLTVGPGGRGGGGLVIECGGSLNFTTANGISVAGKNGANATNTGYTTYSAGGSGGGGGGCAIVLYNTLVSSVGSINVSGGTGGNAVRATSGTAFGGGGGGSGPNAGVDGLSSAVNGTKTGGDGGLGLYLLAPNTEY